MLVSAAVLERSRAHAVASSESVAMCGGETSESANSERRAVLRLSHRRRSTLMGQGDGERCSSITRWGGDGDESLLDAL